jgi:hypothetical protein
MHKTISPLPGKTSDGRSENSDLRDLDRLITVASAILIENTIAFSQKTGIWTLFNG